MTNRTRSRIQRTSESGSAPVQLHRRAARRVPRSRRRARAARCWNTPTVSTSRGQPPHDVAHEIRVHLPRARREHEAERVGAERDREERVLLVRDAADLDEHVRPLSAATGAAPRGSRTSAVGIVGAYERLADQHRVEPGRRHPRARRPRCAPRSRRRRSRRPACSADSDSATPRSSANVREVAAVDADDRARRPRARARPRAASCASTSTPMPELRSRARGDRRAPRRPGIAATISRIASAPIARAS